MEPTQKSGEIDQFITKALGIQRRESIQKEICAICHKKVDPKTDFRDKFSLREYSISGMCQRCQDRIFGQ